MKGIKDVWLEMCQLSTRNELFSYWEKQQKRLLNTLNEDSSDYETTVRVLHLIAKTLNDKEQYPALYYLYSSSFVELENKLPASAMLNELKFEMGRGLHHNRRYPQAKRLFLALEKTDFDTSRFEEWIEQTLIASELGKRHKTQPKFFAILNILVFVGSFAVVAAFDDFFLTITLLIFFLGALEIWQHLYQIRAIRKENGEETDLKGLIKFLIPIFTTVLVLPTVLLFLKFRWSLNRDAIAILLSATYGIVSYFVLINMIMPRRIMRFFSRQL